jgi:hypothetical protein
MATFVLIHAAGDGGWSWHLVEAALRERGHGVVAPDLPADDASAGLWTYADVVIDAIDGRTDLVVVGHSFGGFTAPLVSDRVSAKLLVLLAPMIPSPGEAPGDWWANTGHEQEVRVPDDEMEAYYHDVPPALAEEALRRVRDHPSAASMREPWPLSAWPDVPTRVLLCRDDRVFPAAFLRSVARERLGITPDEIDGGHCISLSRPGELAERLESYLVPHAPP